MLNQRSFIFQFSFDQFWGRPGAGAPLPQGTKKVNLDKILRLPDIHNGSDVRVDLSAEVVDPWWRQVISH